MRRAGALRRVLAWALRGLVRAAYRAELAWAWLRLAALQVAVARLPPVALLTFDDEAARRRLAAWVARMTPRWAAERRALDTLEAAWLLRAWVRRDVRLRWVARVVACGADGRSVEGGTP